LVHSDDHRSQDFALKNNRGGELKGPPGRTQDFFYNRFVPIPLRKPIPDPLYNLPPLFDVTMGDGIHMGVNNGDIFNVPVRLLSFKDKVVHTQDVAGNHIVGCRRSGTFAQGFCSLDDLIENNQIQNFNRGYEEYGCGEYKKDEHKKGEFEPDGSEHF
jgi:hypothetical protein